MTLIKDKHPGHILFKLSKKRKKERKKKLEFISQSKHDGIYLCFRILLVFIAILSAYSIHLLLKSAGVVGKSIHFAHVTYHVCVIKCVWYFRHSSLRAAREPGFRSPGKDAGCLHHYGPQHWRYCCIFCCLQSN